MLMSMTKESNRAMMMKIRTNKVNKLTNNNDNAKYSRNNKNKDNKMRMVYKHKDK